MFIMAPATTHKSSVWKLSLGVKEGSTSSGIMDRLATQQRKVFLSRLPKELGNVFFTDLNG